MFSGVKIANAILTPESANVNPSIITETLSINDLLESIECLTRYIISQKRKNYMSKLLEQINNEKKTYQLADFAILNPQVFLEKGKTYPFLDMSEVQPLERMPKLENTKIFNGSGAKFLESDTLFARITPCLENGKITRVVNLNQPAFGSTEFIVLRGKDNISDGDFLYYLCRTYSVRKKAEQSMIGASGRQRVERTAFEKIEIMAPSLPTQKKIASILGAYDEKIENNNKIIKNLEETAQTIFNEWFVNFKFPGYEKVKMVDSEMGEIPEGWEVKILGDLIDVSGGYSYKGEYLSDMNSKTLLVTMGNISPNKRFNFDSLRYYNGEFPERFLLKPGDIAVATRDVTQDRVILGSPLVIPKLLNNKNVLLATNMYSIKNLGYVSNIFLFHLFRSDSYRERMITSAKGSNILMLTKDTILGFEFILPGKEVLNKFIKYAEVVKNNIEMLVEENISLKSQRDLLLTKLV